MKKNSRQLWTALGYSQRQTHKGLWIHYITPLLAGQQLFNF